MWALKLIFYALDEFKDGNRILGFDTFEGLLVPDASEVDVCDNNMCDKFLGLVNNCEKLAFIDYEAVFKNLNNIYSNVIFTKVVVNEATNMSFIKHITMLRLDMDWFDATKLALKNFLTRFKSRESKSLILMDIIAAQESKS